jgi:HK97 family phage portal protein
MHHQLSSTHVVGVFASTLSHPTGWLSDVLTGYRESDAGVAMNWRNSLGLSALWHCIDRISNDIAQMPLRLYSRTPGTTEEDFSHPAGKVLRTTGDSPVDSFHLRKLLQSHALLWGNGRAYIVRSGRQEPAEFIPLPADRTYTVVIYDSVLDRREKWHVIWPEDGREPIPVPDRDVLHIYGMSYDGYNGLSPMEVFRNTFGLAAAGEKAANRHYRNGGVPALVLEAPPGAFRDESQAREFLSKWNEYHSGLDNSGRTGLLREGIKANVLGMPLKDAQMIEQREFQVREIMRIYNMPAIPGVADSQSYNTLEQLNRAYLLHCLGPWMRVWEQACNKKLLTERERRTETYFFEFDTWELVKPDANAFATMASTLITARVNNPNEIREMFGYPPYEGGDEFANPAITPGQSGAEADDTDTEEDEPAANRAATALARRTVQASLRRLVKVEANKIKDAAAKAKNFVKTMEEFYGRWGNTFSTELCAIGGETWHAERHVDESLARLLTVAEQSTTATLVANVTQEVESWNTRADLLAETILTLELGT